MATYIVRTTHKQLAFEIRRRDAELREAIRGAAVESSNRTMRRVIRNSPVDQGFYKSSWEVLIGGATERVLAELRNDAPHAGIIEHGTRPFMPPLAPIYEWVLRNMSYFGGRRVGARERRSRIFRRNGTLSASGERRLQALRIAKAIRFKIARKGLPAHHVMRSQVEFARRTMRETVNRRLALIAR